MSETQGELTEVTKAASAFQHFQKMKMTAIKDDLISSGQDSGLGAIMQAVSAKWKSLSDDERAEYELIASEDRERYEMECRIRDAEYLRAQEERRKQNTATETESRMRNSTMVKSDASTVKADVPKRQREQSEREKEATALRRQAKMEEARAIEQQHTELKQSKADQAEARLKFLLNQSDIFSHFGVKVASKKPQEAPGRSEEGRGRRKKGSNGGGGGLAEDELDDDELAMLEEEEDSEDEAAGAPTPSKGHTGALVRQPSCIVGGQMRAYQLEGLNWMAHLTDHGINGILADEMGLGKTLQSISILGYMHEFKNISGPHLVIVPKSTLSNWMNEFARWCPALRPIRFHGDKEERAHLAETVLKPSRRPEDRSWDVVVTTYEVSNMERGTLSKIAWRFLIIDEAHRLKNEASQFSTNVRSLHTEHRLLLTGTPLQNNLHELWALLNFLLPDVFSSAEQFDEWFNLDVDDTEAKQRMIGQLHKILRPFMLRRLKADVEKSLPPKIETILYTGLSVMQKNVYRQVLMRDIDQINTNFGGNSSGSRTAILNIVMQLRKCCNHPYLFPGIEDRNENPFGEHIIANCGKMALMDKLLKRLHERKNRVLIFSQMTRMLDILEDYCAMRDYGYCRIDGNTSYEDREDRIEDYNRPGSDKFIFLLSTRAGGLGINLQTADTVIIYDSDWNPQADLQAQDRCHRIGQTKQVHVYRLVTDDTVEVKVVERAQQKLKLDAMVVQQGRLQEKDKKMSKTDLLDTLKFGADKIFRTKDSSSITDEDIDIILEKGRHRTEELSEKLQTADKGDMYDFRLDGGTGTQMFEGKDYSDRSMRESSAMSTLGFIDTGPRERKPIVNYSEGTKGVRPADSGDKKLPKMPRHLRLPKMEDWQFYDRDRLQELQDEETKIFDQLVEKGELPPAGSISKLVLLDTEAHDEKNNLLAQGFGDWNRYHYSNFVKASAKYGRTQFEKISDDVGRPVDEVTRYAAVFWEKGPLELPLSEWEKVTKQVEKGEKRLEEIERLTAATSRLVCMFKDPWEELTFKHIGGQGRLFNAVEDRYLLCLTHLHGYGNWDRVRSSIRRCERFRFDYYLLSCTAEALGKRCESLMRLAEREIVEIDKKQQTSESASGSSGSSLLATAASATGIAGQPVPGKSVTSIGPDTVSMQERMQELVKQISDEARRLAATRAELQKTKKMHAEAISEKKRPGAGGKKGKMEATKSEATANEATANTIHRGQQKLAVPDHLMPELCKLLVKSGPDGLAKVVNTFTQDHPSCSKRQVEIRVSEIAVKEKRAGDSSKVWHIRDEFQHHLETGPSSSKKKKSESVTKKRKSVQTPTASTSASQQSTGKGSKKKSRTESSGGNASSATPKSDDGAGKSKKKNAFSIFVKDKRAEVEAQLGPDSDTTALKNELLSMWHALSADEKAEYEAKELNTSRKREAVSSPESRSAKKSRA